MREILRLTKILFRFANISEDLAEEETFLEASSCSESEEEEKEETSGSPQEQGDEFLQLETLVSNLFFFLIFTGYK